MMIMEMERRELFLAGLQELKLTVTDQQVDLFDHFMALMLEWNEKINLTSITEPEEVITKHFIDSLVPLAYQEKYGLDFSSILDMGTGGGFPGVPLKIMLEDSFVMLADSLQKRISYLQIVITELGLKRIETVHGRAEEIGQNTEYREQYRTVFSRAVAATNILAEYCLPIVEVGGCFIALKGPDVEEELNEGKKAIELLGGKIIGVENLELPIIKDRRSLIFIKKVKTTPSKYPRRAGLPAKTPLK